MLILEILGCDEGLDVVDSQSIVDSASCALELAVLMADSAAYCRERVVSLDKFKSFSVFASGCHIDVSLDGDVERACSLARCRTCRPCLDDAVLVLVVPVPLLFRPYTAFRQLALRIFDLAVLCAELLSESDSACRADLYALAAGYALLCVDLGCVCGSGQVRCVEELRCTESVADSDRAVADREDLVLAVDVCYLVYISLLLSCLEYLESFFISDVVAHAGIFAVVSKVAETHAPVLLDVSGTFASLLLLLTAGADAQTDLAFILLEPV